MKKLIPIIAIIFLAYSCTDKTSTNEKDLKSKDKTNNNTEETSSNKFQKSEKDIFLEGVYGTSTRLPFFEYHAGNCFDGKTETAWITMNGAGPNEGVMCYFAKPEYVKEISILPFQRDNLAKINIISVYCNGNEIGDYELGTAIKIDKEIISLFIKIKDVENQLETPMQVQEPEGEEGFVEVFDKDYAVGISEIQIFDNDGQKQVKAPVMIKGNVSSTSVLEPEAAYHCSNLFDSKKDLVWVEGALGRGVDEQIFFTFSEEVSIDGIIVFNGYQRSDSHYKSNARVKSLEFFAKESPEEKEISDISDMPEKQEITFSKPQVGKEFILSIKDIFSGEKYEDLAIAEIRFMSAGVPFIIYSAYTEENIIATKGKIEGSILEKILDRNIRNNYIAQFNEYFSFNRSFLLRSDNTFVMYNDEYDEGISMKDTLKIVADGNWELIEANEKTAKIRVFGKYASLTDDYGMYKGEGAKTFQKIFQDFVIINSKNIVGEKFIEELILPAQ
ncbi:MAG: hypothetical protein JXR58_07980 [Bacteroidales bacterium]|nr:hypothetical protein [Bacteroidales bacterium]